MKCEAAAAILASEGPAPVSVGRQPPMLGPGGPPMLGPGVLSPFFLRKRLAREGEKKKVLLIL